MKILCIGRNYAAHAAELGNAIPEEPVVFCKPDSALLGRNLPFVVPSFSQDIHHELEVVLRIGKVGKHIEPRFAHKYIDAVTVGLDFTARDLQSELKSKGLPWEKAKGFDGSAVVGAWKSPDILDGSDLAFSLLKNGQTVQTGVIRDMIHSPEQIIAHLSRYFTLKTGDLIFTGTPAGVGPVVPGDHLEGFLADDRVFSVNVR
ncbi:MAG: fumarylacetoacetate hydrolase family protein [Schleiferiaceae bacterium]|jgi:2-keto-4-pentenoate hydratase/2-oxohepta-3-ene-1,7-dioic acid hydratase in catechol pathway|nr:fumarylacetoacetate hydrolase family protein [Schleiferiaceae bacterium]MDP4627430.1 fumarylacetoacetate hydrolase family protein [Schleiferiaceae bacterium]MDP4727841.1 fumarylacetoacetate hydrolase family protein [Schleiferiaceae bacterium]MDP4749674.1 fumarylacetoacetate hydrolase family protein [Schleiferiaceae bacterium]MDP4858863.1 fumarylacetoacetate hydrolase family protein [Schleiferiaceae bacterium]